MSTERPRIQVTIDEQVHGAIAALAVKRQMSKSALAALLISEAIELQEDLYFAELTEQRLKEGGRFLSHAEVWGHD